MTRLIASAFAVLLLVVPAPSHAPQTPIPSRPLASPMNGI